MELKEFKALGEALDAAEESVVPFPVAGEELAVVGDANATEINKHDYKITFRVPKDGKYAHKTVEYKDVYITPRQDAQVMKALTVFIPYFRKLKDNGDVEKMTEEEVTSVFRFLGDDFFDAVYDVVAAVLRIDNDLKNYMTPDSAIEAATQIITDFPETVNAADTFFG